MRKRGVRKKTTSRTKTVSIRPKISDGTITEFWQKCFLSLFARMEDKKMLHRILFVSSLNTVNVINYYKRGEFGSDNIRGRLGISKGEYSLFDKYDLVISVIFTKIGEKDGHYALLVLYSETPYEIYYYDSVMNYCLESCKSFIVALCKANLVPRTVKLTRILDYPQQSSNFECGYIVCGMIQVLTIQFTTLKTGDKMMPLISKQYPVIDDKQLGLVEDYIHLSLYTYLLNFFNDRWTGSEPIPDIPHLNNFEEMYRWVIEYIKLNYSS